MTILHTYRLILLLLLTGGITGLNAQFATSGTGKYLNNIYWLKWAAGQDGIGLLEYPNMSGGLVLQKGTNLPSGQYIWYLNSSLRVVGQLTINSGDLKVHTLNDYWANGLQFMYAGIDPVSIATPGSSVNNFGIKLSLQTLNGNVWTPVIGEYQGVVIADAESMAYSSATPTSTEYIGADVPASSDWYLIDVPKVAASSSVSLRNDLYHINFSTVNSNVKRLYMYISGAEASNVGHAAVMYAKGATELTNIEQKGAGITALSIGFFMPTVASTAPESYGIAHHLQEAFDLAGMTPLSNNNTIQQILQQTGDSLPRMEPISIVRFESSTESPLGVQMPSVINKDYGIDIPIDIDATNLFPVDAFVYAWIDINGDGIFSADEFLQFKVPTGTTAENFSLHIPGAWLANSYYVGNTWARFRITTDSLIAINTSVPGQDSRSISFAGNGQVVDLPIRITSSILPSSIIDFTGHSYSSGNEIVWSTASELNSSHFELYKRTGEQEEWQLAGIVKVRGISNTTTTYRFWDSDITAGITTYYRVKHILVNDQEQYSKILALQQKRSIAGEPYPLPFTNQLSIPLMIEKSGTYTFEIFSLESIKVYELAVHLNAGRASAHLDQLASLHKGVYLLRIRYGKEIVYSGKIIK